MGLLVDVLFLGIVQPHQELDQLDDALGVPDQVPIGVLSVKPASELSQKTREIDNLPVSPAHGAKTRTFRKIFGEVGIDATVRKSG